MTRAVRCIDNVRPHSVYLFWITRNFVLYLVAEKRIHLHLIENTVHPCVRFSLFLFLLVSLHLPALLTNAGVTAAIPCKRQCGSDGLFLALARPACIACVRREHHISITR